MWLSVFSKIITSVHIKAARIIICFFSNFYTLSHLIRASLKLNIVGLMSLETLYILEKENYNQKFLGHLGWCS